MTFKTAYYRRGPWWVFMISTGRQSFPVSAIKTIPMDRQPISKPPITRSARSYHFGESSSPGRRLLRISATHAHPLLTTPRTTRADLT
jgi:hypothetical protein